MHIVNQKIMQLGVDVVLDSLKVLAVNVFHVSICTKCFQEDFFFNFFFFHYIYSMRELFVRTRCYLYCDTRWTNM